MKKLFLIFVMLSVAVSCFAVDFNFDLEAFKTDLDLTLEKFKFNKNTYEQWRKCGYVCKEYGHDWSKSESNYTNFSYGCLVYHSDGICDLQFTPLNKRVCSVCDKTQIQEATKPVWIDQE